MKINSPIQSASRRVAILAFATIAISLASFSPIQAVATPTFKTANGYFGNYVSDVYTTLGTFGGDTFYRENLTFPYSGDLVGTATDVNYIVVHADGSFESFATEVCTGCTLGGKTGSFTAVYYIDGADFANFIYTGYFTFTGGTGGLAGLNGSGTFGGANVNYSYSYHYRFGH